MSEIIDFESVMRDQMMVTAGRINPSTVRMLIDMGFRITKDQTIYDEAKEQEALVMPERKPEPSCMTEIDDDREASIWNACLDEVYRLNKAKY